MTSPFQLPIMAGHAYIFLCHLGFVTKLSCWQGDCSESRLQRLRPPIPTASQSRGKTWALQSFYPCQHMMCLIKDFPFSVAHLHHRVAGYFRRQYRKQGMHRMLLSLHGLQKALALRTIELEVAS